MKNTILALLLGSTVLASCSKTTDNSCGPVETAAPASEIADLQSYISSNGISATADSRGFFYSISKPGSELHPNVCSTVKVNYSLRLSNGTPVEANNNVSFGLGGVILGWQEGIPLIGEGGSITLYLPPSLGYGSQGSSSIPANSILVFHVDLVTVR